MNICTEDKKQLRAHAKEQARIFSSGTWSEATEAGREHMQHCLARAAFFERIVAAIDEEGALKNV